MAKKAEDPNQKQSFPRELLDQSPAARLAYFKSYTVAHPFLQRANKEIWDALQEPGGALMIFIVGPTGVGKTTLWEYIDQRLTEAAQTRMLQDPDHMPVINLYAMAPSSRQFRWPDFYTRALMAVSEPLIDYKVDSQAIIPIYNEKMRRHVPPQLVGDAAMLQRSWEQVLRYRKPNAIFVDEAQHLAKTAGGSRLIDQLDHVKSLAVATKTMHVLAGTYELLVFRNLNAQLSRRSIDVHLPRYRAEVKDERLAFQNVLLTFQRQLPLEEAPDLVHQWKICYTRTVGCVGLLKNWLTKALREAVESGEKTISPALLLKHAASADRCDQYITDIEEGERSLNTDPRATERLMERLGLNTRTRRTKENSPEDEEGGNRQKRRLPHLVGGLASATPRAMRSRRRLRAMNEAQVLELPQWNLAEERLPRRSMLYAPAPVGMGTAMGESLTSYLARLAAAHCVYPGILLREMILPMLEEAETQDNGPEQHPLWRRDGSGSHLINVTGTRAQAALQVLETLTMCTDLGGLSLSALTEILPLRGLTRSKLAWCSLCYEEWQANEQVVYDPLLWKFREVSLCVHHGVRLQTSCPNCARSLPHLAWRSRPGYCPFCAWPLFGGQVERQESIDREKPEFIWQQWVTDALGAVIAHLPSAQGSPRRRRLRLVVNQAVERLADGNIAAFARLLDLSRNTVENWCQGKRIPEMDMLLRLCYRLDLSLCEVLFEEEEMLQPSLRDPVPPALFPSRKRTAINKESISHQLEQAASRAENPPPSLKEVGKLLGYQPTTLYKINRAACHAIAERFTAYRQELREKRLQGYREEIRQIALYLRAEQTALTQRHISRYLTQPAILRDPKVRELLREVCHELETSDGEKPL